MVWTKVNWKQYGLDNSKLEAIWLGQKYIEIVDGGHKRWTVKEKVKKKKVNRDCRLERRNLE